MDVTWYLLVKAVPGNLILTSLQRCDFVSQIRATDRGNPFGQSDGLPYYYRLATDGTDDQINVLFEQHPDTDLRRWMLDIDALPVDLLAALAAGETVEIPYDQLIDFVEAR